jgi:hypothetical protein
MKRALQVYTNMYAEHYNKDTIGTPPSILTYLYFKAK